MHPRGSRPVVKRIRYGKFNIESPTENNDPTESKASHASFKRRHAPPPPSQGDDEGGCGG
ncbi:hypothetical protein K523DRAFT_122496 [Schizophyllum commune Tattone D]|nr:hypothetical protein K523DRAFT_122496 [Schizophyllum commune Tattone D]